jgi:hypothetical protein
MTFFYDLNKRLADVANKKQAEQLSESATGDYSAKKARAGKDIGKPGKQFAKIAKSAGERYGSKERGEKVAGAVLNKLRGKNESVEESVPNLKGHDTKYGVVVVGHNDGKPVKTFDNEADAKAFADKGIRVGGGLKQGSVRTMVAPKKKTNEASTDESALQAYLGKKKYGDAGMKALQQAGREGASKEKMARIRAQHDKMDEADMEEGNEFSGELAQARAAGAKQFKVDGKEYPVKETEMTPKQKSFAKLAPPTDKVTFADKIAGAKKEVDEMLGDVAADAMRKAVGSKKVDVPAYQRKASGAKNWKVTQKDLTADKGRNISDPATLAKNSDVDEGWDDMLKYVKDKDSQGATHKTSKGTVTKTATGLRHTRDYDPETGETNTGDDAPAGEKRGRGRPAKYSADKPRQERVTAKSRKADRTAYTKKKVAEYGDFGPMEDQDPVADRGEYDREGDMAKEQMHTIMSAAKELRNMLKDEENLPEWVQKKITLAKEYIDSARDYMSSQHAEQSEEKPIAEKAVSKKQQKFMGMVHAAQKGEKPASKEVAKTAKSMGKKAAEDFAATKHKGLPEKVKAKKEGVEQHSTPDLKAAAGKDRDADKKSKVPANIKTSQVKDELKKRSKKEVEETTVAGNVAPAAAAPKAKSGGMQFGKGIYDSMNRELETMISESININMSSSTEGGNSLTITATEEDAVKLAELLKMAGLGSGDVSASEEACPACDQAPCGCDAEMMDENKPDWPTDSTEAKDNFEYSGGLNGPKSTGQTTVPVIASQEERQHSYADEEQDAIKRMMEMAGIKEAAKPDFLDVDKDSDKKEAFKKAVKDKEEKKVEESIFALTNSWKEYKG